MSFENLSLLSVGAGLAALAAILFALQRLRVRYRDVPVVTLLFWREAVELAPVRVLRQRFRHFLAYLLILAICVLIWLAFADPRWAARSAAEESYVLLLDGSAGMSLSNSFAEAVATLKKDVARLPDDGRRVFWVGATVKRLLGPGEHPVLLDHRLTALGPEPAPSRMEEQLRQLAAETREGQSSIALIYGNAPVRQEIVASLPPSLTVLRAVPAQSPERNAGIAALGVAEAASGRWPYVDVLVRVERISKASGLSEKIAIAIDGKPIPTATIDARGAGDFLLRDVPAQGGLLEVQLPNDDGFPIDNVARLRLPNRPQIRVLLSSSLVRELGAALAADPAIELTSGDADIVIRRQGERLGEGLPALEFAPRGAMSAAFTLTDLEQDAATDLAALAKTLGLNQIDATALAIVAQQPIQVTVTVGSARKFVVWAELLGDKYNFVQSRSFPLFIAKSARWLADVKAFYPFVAAGQPLADDDDGQKSLFVNRHGGIVHTLGGEFVPPRAGNLLVAGAAPPLAASLLDQAVTMGVAGAPIAIAGTRVGAAYRSQNLVTWLLLCALILLLIEWFFYRRGWMP